MLRCFSSFNGTNGIHLTAWALHNEMPLIATAAIDQNIRLMDLEGTIQGFIRSYKHGARLTRGLDSVTSMSFHPYLPKLAIGVESSAVSVFSPNSIANLDEMYM
jgi:hypothetical protein